MQPIIPNARVSRRWLHLLPGLILGLHLLPALALYKVVQPDGSITYTDRPPSSGNARVIDLGRASTAAASAIGLPLELRQVAARYPVTLYSAPDCAPCDDGRKLLQQRGVPYSERLILSEDDAAALQRLVGGRAVPALSIGPQPLRGFSETDWGAYLDVAGYPRLSRLPSGWPQPDPVPLTERAPQPAAERAAMPQPAAPRPASPAETETPAPPEGLRF